MGDEWCHIPWRADFCCRPVWVRVASPNLSLRLFGARLQYLAWVNYQPKKMFLASEFSVNPQKSFMVKKFLDRRYSKVIQSFLQKIPQPNICKNTPKVAIFKYHKTFGIITIPMVVDNTFTVARSAAGNLGRSRSAIAAGPQPQVFHFKSQSKEKLGK